MKTIGEQAKEFRLSKKWNTTEMARAVGTSRQNIESLEEKGDRIPRYLADLAKAMGTTSDTLLTGRYEWDESDWNAVNARNDEESATADELNALLSKNRVVTDMRRPLTTRQKLEGMLDVLNGVDDLTLGQVKDLMKRLLDEPHRSNEIITRIEGTIDLGNRTRAEDRLPESTTSKVG